MRETKYPETFLMSVYDGNLIRDDTMYFKILKVLKERCDENDITYSDNEKEQANLLFHTIVETINEQNQVKLSFSGLDQFEEELSSNIEMIKKCPPNERVLMLDSIANQDFMHNPTPSVIELVRRYIASRLQNLDNDVIELMSYINTDIEDEDTFDPFKDDEAETTLSIEEKETYKHQLEFYKMLPELSPLFKVIKQKRSEIKKLRNTFLIDQARENNPEYIEQLEKLQDEEDEMLTYYYHGAATVATEKIMEEGLYMQYGTIERTAVPHLTPAEILAYSYGQENVGRHAIVIIAVEGNQEVVEENLDTNVRVGATGQGLAQFELSPPYKIPSQYIYGYINKDDEIVVRNPKYQLKEEKEETSSKSF